MEGGGHYLGGDILTPPNHPKTPTFLPKERENQVPGLYPTWQYLCRRTISRAPPAPKSEISFRVEKKEHKSDYSPAPRNVTPAPHTVDYSPRLPHAPLAPHVTHPERPATLAVRQRLSCSPAHPPSPRKRRGARHLSLLPTKEPSRSPARSVPRAGKAARGEAR